MGVISIAVSHLIAAGVTGDALVTAIAQMEAAAPAPVVERSSGAKRQERYRNRHKPSQVTDGDAGQKQEEQSKAEILPPDPERHKASPVTPGGDIGGESSFLLSQQDSGKEDSGSVVAREPDEVEQLRDLWNETAEELGLAKVQHLSEARRKSARKRLAECGGMEGMHYAMAQIRASPGLQGKAGGRAWKADFDWLLQPSSFTKLMEGKYDHWQKPKSDLMAAADRLRERVGAGHRENAQGGRAENGLFDRADGAGEVLDDHLSY